jgi:dienelactone hydrolase
VVDLHLVDASRVDPWEPSKGHRGLMVSVVYPARDAGRYPVAPLMTAGVRDGFNALAAPINYEVPGDVTVDWSAIRTPEHVGAPVAGGRHPVVLYSPGAGDVRSWDSVLVDQLASSGYVVVTIDPTYEASAVEFPQGIVRSELLALFTQAQQDGTVPQFLKKLVDTRVADTKFVLDELGVLAGGGNPDAEGRALPGGLGRMLDLGRVGMFGQSAGGFTALEAAYEDPRIRAAIDMDGTLEYNAGEPSDTNFSPVASGGLAKPFLVLGSQTSDACTASTDPSCAAVLRNSAGKGWHAAVTLPGTVHGSFTDAEVLVPQLADVLPAAAVTDDVGNGDPRVVVAQEESLISGFFRSWL